jgi:hypothetical protein
MLVIGGMIGLVLLCLLVVAAIRTKCKQCPSCHILVPRRNGVCRYCEHVFQDSHFKLLKALSE